MYVKAVLLLDISPIIVKQYRYTWSYLVCGDYDLDFLFLMRVYDAIVTVVFIFGTYDTWISLTRVSRS